MNFYPFHLGDYKTHTHHLTPLEDICYRRCLDHYYLNEKPLPFDLELLARLIGMRDQHDIVIDIVTTYFQKGENGWYSKRCDEEISRFREKQLRASKLAQKRWHGTEKECDVVCDTQCQSSATKTNTNIDTKPVSKKVAVAPVVVIPEALNSEKFKANWDAYLAYRKEMRFKTLKVTSLVQILNKLANWGEDAAIESINTSIRNGWQGLFEPRTQVNAIISKPVIAKPNKYANAW